MTRPTATMTSQQLLCGGTRGYASAHQSTGLRSRMCTTSFELVAYTAARAQLLLGSTRKARRILTFADRRTATAKIWPRWTNHGISRSSLVFGSVLDLRSDLDAWLPLGASENEYTHLQGLLLWRTKKEDTTIQCALSTIYINRIRTTGLRTGELDDGSGHVGGNVSKDGGTTGRCWLFSR